jgi:lysophospholipase L1-like esterase
MKNKKIKIIVFGDSILRGVTYDTAAGRLKIATDYASRIGDATGVDIRNLTKLGLTSERALLRYKEQLDGSGCRYVVLEFGGNDCNYDWAKVAANPTAAHDPVGRVERFTENLESMILYAKKRKKEVILPTLPPLSAKKFFDFITKDGLSRENILCFLGDVEHIYRHHERYNAAILRLALKHKAEVIDLRDAFLRENDCGELLSADGMHPSGKGQEVVYGTLVDYVRQRTAHG